MRGAWKCGSSNSRSRSISFNLITRRWILFVCRVCLSDQKQNDMLSCVGFFVLFFFKVFKFSGFVFFQFAGQVLISVQWLRYYVPPSCTCTVHIDPCKNYQKEQGSPYVQNKLFIFIISRFYTCVLNSTVTLPFEIKEMIASLVAPSKSSWSASLELICTF